MEGQGCNNTKKDKITAVVPCYNEEEVIELFYREICRVAEQMSEQVDYRLMSRQMVDAVLKMSERNRFTKGIFSWVGFHTKWIPYENVERAAGKTKWSFWKLLKYSMEGIIGFSTVPLALVSIIGVLFCIGAFITIMYIIIKTIVWGDPVGGWPSLACMVLGVSGVQLFCMGILGQYLGKIYLEVKNRPIYLASIVEMNDDDTAEIK